MLWNGKGLACEASLECRNCGVHELGLYGMLGYRLCCEILLLLDMAYMDCLLCRRLYIVQCSFSGCE